ncbi:MAG: S9 family peptidase [candidate division Zixibacteria bacterium]|nr:S9 family peptidase [candidate division Zixibacteria bacterium]
MPSKKIKHKRSISKKTITAKDLFKLKFPTAVAISPDEKKIISSVERMDEKENKYFSNLFIFDIENNTETQFTFGNQYDRQMVWSPCGDKIAFVSTREKTTGIYIMSVLGGAEKKIIEIDGSIGSLQWTPDGNSLLLNLRYNDSHFIEDEKKKKEPPVYRHITKFFFRLDGAGYLPKDSFQIYSLNIENGKLRKITKGKRDCLSPSISANGKWIAYASNRSKDPDLNSLSDDLFIIPSNGGKEKKIATPPGPIAIPVFSPDGKNIAYLGHDNPNDAWGVTNLHVWKVNLTGSPKAHDLMPKFDRMAFDQSISDMGDVHDAGNIYWSYDGKRIYFVSSDTGATNLYYVSARGGKPTAVYKKKSHIKAASFNEKTKKVALIDADITNPGEVFVCPTTYESHKSAIQLSQFNKFLSKDIKLSKTKDLFFKSFDGTNVQGWLVYPPNFNPNKKYPAILEIHGGPRTQYAHSFFHEMQYLAAQGFVVFYTNPRGGSGRGETWADAISGGWGEIDYMDCMAAADYLENLKFVNEKKIGVTGGSYGGYMTNWMISHTNRFAAAVTQRSVVDLKSFTGSSDIGYELSREFDGWPWTNKENYEKCSPITHFRNVKTPVLIIHSEQDLRCNIEQADQMFVMLKALGKKVEMVRFPEEPHGLSRHGRPDRRIARLEWIVKWFKKYM